MCAPAEGAGENLQDQSKAIKYFSQKLGKMGAMKILIGKYRNSKVRHQEKEKKRGKGKQKQDKKKNPVFSEQNLSHVYFTLQTALPHSLQLDL